LVFLKELNLSSNRLLLIAFAITTTFFVIVIKYCALRYDANDDFQMMMIASGALNGLPDEHLVFTNALIGEILKHLYQMNAAFNWYPIYLYLFNFLASLAIAYSLLKKIPSFVGLLAIGLFLLIGEFRLITSLQFTTTAAIVGLAGLVLIICNPQRHLGVRLIVGILLFFASSLIREQVFYMLIVTLLPLLAFRIYQRKIYSIHIVAILVTFLLFGVAKGYDNSQYNAPAWKSYDNYIHVMGKLKHNPAMNFNKNSAVFKKIGWDKDDFKLFSAWVFEDKTIYSYENLIYILENINKYDSGLELGISNIITAYAKPFLLIQLLIITFVCVSQGKRGSANILIPLTIIGLVSIYFAFTNRIPGRLADSLLLIPFLISLFQLASLSKSRQKVLIYLIIFILPVCMLDNMRIGKRAHQTQSEIGQLRQYYSGNYLVALGRALNFDDVNPLQTSIFFDPKIYILSWLSHSPINDGVLRRLGYSNIYMALLAPSFYLLIHNDDLYIIESIERFYKKHYGISISIIKNEHIKGTVGAYKVLNTEES